MSWNGFREEEEERGLELSLGLPGYFSKSPGLKEKASEGGGATGAKGSNGFKARGLAIPAFQDGLRTRDEMELRLKSHLPFFKMLNMLDSYGEIQQPQKWDHYTDHGGKGAAHAKIETGHKGLFVKINIDGVLIGRKVDLKAHGSYDKLSAAVDQLFQGLLAAQRDPAITASESCTGEKQKVITGLLDGSGEYTLVYEDDEGDQMLVGDVPWDMFISTVKRLRVLRSSDLNVSSLRAVSRKRAAAEC